ncbi:hypothetical protein [Mesorhizobium sp. M0088]|uniref:hypothetical protein n=1 Tax=Mesorhizobium sp. M0088 TaxID=2956873 RepID=UPI0033384098
MNDTPKINSILHVNGLVWITSLRESEVGVTRRLVEDLEVFCNSIRLPFFVEEPQTAVDLLRLLDELALAARVKGFSPIIHFDTHAGKETGLAIAASDESIPWEVLMEKLRAINIATRNNLCVISFACYGFHQAVPITILKEAPFYMLAAPDKIVRAGYVERVVVPFYTSVFTEMDIMGSFQRHLGEELLLLHSEELFLTSVIGYIREKCIGKAAQRRVEDLLTQARKEGILLTPERLKQYRKLIRTGIKPTQGLLDRWVTSFLLGKPISFQIADVMNLVHKQQK